MARKTDLLQGTLDLLILRTLSAGPLHGYAIGQQINQTSRALLQVPQGSLYPALHRLELRGLLLGEWGLSENNRRATFYRLTAAGRKHLADEASTWGRLSGAITRVMQTA